MCACIECYCFHCSCLSCVYYYNWCLFILCFPVHLYSFLSLATGVLDIVRPFCDVVVNEETTGPITGLAIAALDKFLASGLLGMWHYYMTSTCTCR